MQQIQPKHNPILIHALCWFIYIAYEQLAVFIVSVNYRFSVESFLFYALNILIFYAQVSLMNFLFTGTKPNYLVAAGMITALILVVSILKTLGELWISTESTYFRQNAHLLRRIIILDLVRSVFYVLAGTSFWLVLHSFRLKRKTEEVRYAYLQQQIRPHLLFNTLNFVYSTVYKQSSNGGRAVQLLTELLDFSLQDNQSNKTLLVEEIQQIQNLIELNGLRFDYPLKVKLRIEGEPDSHRIIPLVLLTLVENMFVHGYFRDDPAIIALNISSNGILNFKTVNTSLTQPGKLSRGSGLTNIRTRLAYAYPNRFELNTERLGELFTTKLRINL